jgi:hypothetical protein
MQSLIVLTAQGTLCRLELANSATRPYGIQPAPERGWGGLNSRKTWVPLYLVPVPGECYAARPAAQA